MTCVVALEHKGIAYLGSDSFMGSETTRDQTARPKIFSKGERFVLGFAGSFRAGQIVEHGISFRKLKIGEDEESYLVTEVAKKLQNAFAKAGLNSRDETGSDSTSAQFIACLNGRVFEVQVDYSIIRSGHGFSAIGVGKDFALGALSAMVRSKVTPKDKVLRSLAIAADLSPQVCGPFHIIEV